jgi:calpain-type cysteine protease DEK1
MWRRLHEISECPRVLPVDSATGDVRCSDLLQNRWLIGTLCVLGLQVDQVAACFEGGAAYSPDGVYAVRVFLNGEWACTLIDDRLPCAADGQPAFARSAHPDEFWASLLEKAFAKLYGNYQNLSFTAAKDPDAIAFRILLGQTPHCLTVPQSVSAQQLFAFLSSRLTLADVVAAAARVPDAGHLDHNGLALNQLYGVMEIHEVGALRLLKMRNPYCEGAWNGSFADTSPSWTPDVAALVNHHTPERGAFWITFEEFLTQVCRWY